MTVSTLRPDGTVSTTGTPGVTGAASIHAALSDDSDASYVNFGTDISPHDDAVVSLGDFTLPAGAVIKSFSLRVRLSSPSGGGGGGNLTFHWATVATVPYGNGTPSSVTWTSPTTIVLGPFTGTWTEADFDAAVVEIGQAIGGSQSVFVYEVYLDVTYIALPVVDVTAPTGTITNSNLPTVTWADTLDSDGGAQTFYEVKLFTDAQYVAGGFDPATSSPFDTTGQVAGTATSWTPSTVLPDDTYRAYVRSAQTVNGSPLWSSWDFAEFTIDVDLPAVPDLVLTAEAADGRIRIDVDFNAGTATTDALEVQRSLDAGATWEPVRLTTDTAGFIDDPSATIYDFEAPNGTAVMYRARALHNYSGVYAASDWATDTETWTSTDWWLKCPELPALNTVVMIHSLPSYQRPARQGVFQALGRTDQIVVTDTRGGTRGNVALWVETHDEGAAIDELLDSGATLLLQGAPGDNWTDRYVRLGDQDRARIVDKAWIEPTIDTLAWFEVASPTGPANAWPDALLPADELLPSDTLYPAA
jgi:hypothetical protein